VEAERGVIGGRGVALHAGEPEMREAHGPERRQRSVIDVREFAHAVFRQRSVEAARLVRIAEEPGEKLVDADAFH